MHESRLRKDRRKGHMMSLEPALTDPNDRFDEVVDCVVIGGGPAGLTAAVYLGRFLRRCTVFDAGEGRALSIPLSHNLPASPGGISGTDLLARMTLQARQYGAELRQGKATRLAVAADGFAVHAGTQVIHTRTVLLATGVFNHRPIMPKVEHERAVALGLIRYCPVCDGFEVGGMNIAVLGCDGHGAAEAEFLRPY